MQINYENIRAEPVKVEEKNPVKVTSKIQVFENQYADSLKKMITEYGFGKEGNLVAYSHIIGEIKRNPSLLDCDVLSLVQSIRHCCEFKLFPGPALGHSWLIPKFSKGKKVCTFQLGYKGMQSLAARGENPVWAFPHIIYQNDIFEEQRGTENILLHKPCFENAGPIVGYYAVVKLPNGEKEWARMSMNEMQLYRTRWAPKGEKEGAWDTHFDQMALKTMLRKTLKWVPINDIAARAIHIDEMADSENPWDGEIYDGLQEFNKVEHKKSQAEKLALELGGKNEND